MSETILTCEDVRRDALIERFLAGRLTGADLDAFESHYVTCERCQNELQLGTAIRVSLRSIPVARRSRSWTRWAGVAGLAAAAVIMMVVWRAQSGVSPELRQLGAVLQAPIYLGIPLRSNETDSSRAFDEAMREYQGERYDDAARRLRQLIRVDGQNPPAEFFLGASLLMIGDDDAAAESFGRVIALGDTPYLSEAHFYRAKALLRRGETDAALADLRAVNGRSEVVAAQARALADSISRLRAR